MRFTEKSLCHFKKDEQAIFFDFYQKFGNK